MLGMDQIFEIDLCQAHCVWRPTVDLVKVKPFVDAVDISISMANSCFIGAETMVDTTSSGEDFLGCKASEALFSGI